MFGEHSWKMECEDSGKTHALTKFHNVRNSEMEGWCHKVFIYYDKLHVLQFILMLILRWHFDMLYSHKITWYLLK